MSEREETQESEENEEFEEAVWECFGDMDTKDDEYYTEHCESCDSVEECFQRSYGMTVEQSEWIEGLSDNKPNVVSDVSLKPRKLRKISGLSVGFGIPSLLNSVYSKGSDVLTVYVADQHSLLFISERSLMSEGNIERLKDLFKRHLAVFRSVLFKGEYNVLLIPRQFTDQFSMKDKVELEYDETMNVLFIRSNLSVERLAEIELEKQKKAYTTHIGLKDAVGEKHGFERSEEFKQMEKMKREVVSNPVSQLVEARPEKPKPKESQFQEGVGLLVDNVIDWFTGEKKKDKEENIEETI